MHFHAKFLLLLALSTLLFACDKQEEEEEVVSGKKKIAYAPHQSVKFEHSSPNQPSVNQEQLIHQSNTPSYTQQANPHGQNLPANPHGQTAQQANPHQGLPYAQQANPHGQNLPANPHGQTAQQANPHGQTAQQANPHQGLPYAQQANPHGQSLPANPHGQTAQQANPHTQGLPYAQQGNQQLPQNHPNTTAPMGEVKGTIELKGDLIPEIKPNSVLFISVRRYMENGQGTLIAAIKRTDISASSFPLSYVVTDKDAMMGAPLGGDVKVTARIDQDGDAISKMPGDLTGATSVKVQVGQNPVNFIIDQKL